MDRGFIKRDSLPGQAQKLDSVDFETFENKVSSDEHSSWMEQLSVVTEYFVLITLCFTLLS